MTDLIRFRGVDFGEAFVEAVCSTFDVKRVIVNKGYGGAITGYKFYFENDWCASVIFGPFSYSDNRGVRDKPEDEYFYVWRTNTAEIAGWHGSEGLHRFEGWDDTVKDYVKPFEIAEWMLGFAPLKGEGK